VISGSAIVAIIARDAAPLPAVRAFAAAMKSATLPRLG